MGASVCWGCGVFRWLPDSQDTFWYHTTWSSLWVRQLSANRLSSRCSVCELIYTGLLITKIPLAYFVETNWHDISGVDAGTQKDSKRRQYVSTIAYPIISCRIIYQYLYLLKGNAIPGIRHLVSKLLSTLHRVCATHPESPRNFHGCFGMVKSYHHRRSYPVSNTTRYSTRHVVSWCTGGILWLVS